jgi:hypothetical protein
MPAFDPLWTLAPLLSSGTVSRTIAKIILATAQASWLIVLGGYLLLRTQWVVLPSFVSVLALMKSRCSSCSTPFTDERVYQKFKLLRFWDTRIIDECPVCSHEMFQR